MSTDKPLVNYFESLSKPTVIKSITLQDWIELIKSSEFSNQIADLRTKNLSKSELKIEKAKFPCITPNFLYKGYKKDFNIIRSTGYIYIDIDEPYFDISSIKDRVTAYNKSISGKGYGIYVSVSGINQTNFKTNYRSICKDLGITVSVDDNAIKASQFNVLSYDVEAYYNSNPYIYTANTIVSPSIVISDNSTIVSPSMVITKTNTYTIDGDTSIRFDNLNEIPIALDELYVTNWEEGYEVVKAWIPKLKLEDNRYNSILAYANQIAYLNPNISEERLFNVLMKVQGAMCTTQIEIPRIKSIVNSIMKYLKVGTLKPIVFNKKRRIVFNKKAKLTKDEKLSYVRDELAKHRTNQSLAKIENIIETWDFKDGPITVRGLSKQKRIPVSYKTVCKYCKLFKQLIEEKNKEAGNQNTKSLNPELIVITPEVLQEVYPEQPKDKTKIMYHLLKRNEGVDGLLFMAVDDPKIKSLIEADEMYVLDLFINNN